MDAPESPEETDPAGEMASGGEADQPSAAYPPAPTVPVQPPAPTAPLYPPVATAPAGWYPDPENLGLIRYFDGLNWAHPGPAARAGWGPAPSAYGSMAPMSPESGSAPPPWHGAAVFGLILGILAALASLIPVVGLVAIVPLGPGAILLGIVGWVKTSSVEFRGRAMSVIAIILGAVGIVVAVAWILLLNKALTTSFDDLYGGGIEHNGPGRNEAEALAFGQTSSYPDGLSVTATAPRAATIPSGVLENQPAWNVGFATTVTFTNNSTDPIRFDPGGRAYLGQSDCRDLGSANDDPAPPERLAPNRSYRMTMQLMCRGGGSAFTNDVTVVTWPDQFLSQTWFSGTLPEASRQGVIARPVGFAVGGR